jgi:hypothetical protein
MSRQFTQELRVREEQELRMSNQVEVFLKHSKRTFDYPNYPHHSPCHSDLVVFYSRNEILVPSFPEYLLPWSDGDLEMVQLNCDERYFAIKSKCFVGSLCLTLIPYRPTTVILSLRFS